MEWDTKEVREFKVKFDLRKTGSSREDIIDAGDAFTKALAMLRHRRQQALNTLESIEKEREGKDSRILENLRDEGKRLASETEAPEKARPTNDKQRDVLTEILIAAADKWIAFEAHCISARNEMTLAGPEGGSAKLAENLKTRAARVEELADHL